MAQAQQKEIPIKNLNPQQLMAVKKNVEEEIQMLNSQMNQFKVALQKYEESKTILNSLKTAEQDSELLVPITTSLFVPGQLQEKDKVLIDYGTGYFVERNINQAQGVCDRKLNLLKENANKLNNIVAQKANFLDKVNLEVQRQLAEQQQQIKQQQSAQ